MHTLDFYSNPLLLFFFLRTPKKAVDSGEHEFKVKIGEFAHLGFSYLLTPNSEIALRIAAKLN